MNKTENRLPFKRIGSRFFSFGRRHAPLGIRIKVLLAAWIFCHCAFPVLPAFAYTVAPVRVGLESRFARAASIPVANTALAVGAITDGAFMPLTTVTGQSGFSVRQSEDGRVALYDGDRVVIAAGSVGTGADSVLQIADAAGGFVMLEDAAYRGAMEFGSYGAQGVTAVNMLSMEEYLYSVVPSEMPPEFSLEALKAQAVAARSYLLTRKGVHADEGYDLCDQGHCQHYRGTDIETENSVRAVNETRGQVALYDGQPINAVYHSGSGGATDNAENVWNEALPYLRGVSDPAEYEQTRWTRSFRLDELTALGAEEGHAIGSVTGVAITRTGPGGRVQELTLTGTAGVLALTKEDIRMFFSSSADGSLQSRLFTIVNGIPMEKTAAVTAAAATDGRETTVPGMPVAVLSAQGATLQTDSYTATDGQMSVSYGTAPAPVSSAGDTVTFAGTGWGHGVGLSQRGAEGMAQMGYDYQAILHHYYTGISIE